jgi:hypothetical protein
MTESPQTQAVRPPSLSDAIIGVGQVGIAFGIQDRESAPAEKIGDDP